MPKIHPALLAILIICVLLGLTAEAPPPPSAQGGPAVDEKLAVQGLAPAALADQSIFANPVVPDAVISGYFDHQSTAGLVTFYNGRASSAGAGFTFTCSNPAMNDWVGCEDPVSGETACSNNRELWYDGHHGTDYEFSPNWYTGDTCDPSRFNGITRQIFAPARGQVLMAGTDPNRPANGWHIRIKHDLNGNGNFNDDNFRSVYLHFTANALAVTAGQIVNAGDYLGLGGSTGYSSSPHLHFEVQRSSDYFQTNSWPVDPYGWQGPGGDPYEYQNVKLWRMPPVNYTDFLYIPAVAKDSSAGCGGCDELLQNGGFEGGHTAWDEQGVMIIVQRGEPNLTVSPNSGDWLAWLGGRNSATDVLNQDFTIPAGTARGMLNFAMLITTTETGGAADYFYVRLRKPDGTVLQEWLFNNTYTPRGQWVQQSLSLLDLSPYQGQSLRINFKAVTDASALTNFYLDDVSIQAGP